MKAVRFWGTRGSIPVALTVDEVRRKLAAALRGASGRRFANDAEIEAYIDTLAFADGATFGGHSSCVEIVTGGPDYVICDLGTGVRPFGQAALASDGGPHTYHVFLSHVHWDHIMGLPFFTPAYIPGNRVIIYGGHPHLEAALRRQQEQPSFPVDFNTFRADISFVRLEPGRWHDVAGMRVLLKLQRHSGDSFGFRFESGGKTVVYLEPVALALSKKARKPVKMVMNREEVFRASGPTSGANVWVKIGAKKNGKIVAGEAAVANGRAATQVHGGMGFTWEVDVHLYLKRAWLLDTQFGSADRHADRVAASLRGS